MVPIASFGAGPSGVEFTLALVVAGLVAAALGYGNRSAVLGSVGGGLAGVFIYWLLIFARGGFLGAEVLITAFGLGAPSSVAWPGQSPALAGRSAEGRLVGPRMVTSTLERNPCDIRV